VWAEICCALFASARSGLELLQVAGEGIYTATSKRNEV